MSGANAIKDRDQKLAEQLPDDWEQANEIPDRSVDEEEEQRDKTEAERIKEKLDPDTLMVQRDENGEVIPFEVPLIMHPRKERQVTIKPLTGADEYKVSMIQIEHTEAIDEGDIEQKGDYDVDAETGQLVGYDGLALEQIRILINNHLIEPDLEYDTTDEMLHGLRESMMNALFYTIKVYGLGMSLEENDTLTKVLEDKKK